MIDLMEFWNNLIIWVQWGTTILAGILILLACLGFFLGNRKLTLNCLMVFIILGIVGWILAGYGINIFAMDQIFAFFEQLF